MNQKTIDILKTRSNNVIKLNLSNKNIIGLLDLIKFNSLIKLDCSNNQITNFDNLPNSLIELYCSNNQITNLDNIKKSHPNINFYFL